MLAIAGCSGSGKTTLARELATQLDATLFPLDLYYRDLSQFPLDSRHKRNFDHPDSLETDSARKARPVFHSDAGRIVDGGGAVPPDVVVKEDTLTTAEQTLAKLLAPKSAAYFTVIGDYALELRPSVKQSFVLQPAWREELYRRMGAAGIQVDRKVFDAGQALVNRELEQRIARVAFGDTAARRRSLRDDAPLRKALDLLSTGSSQRDLLARAAVATRGTH